VSFEINSAAVDLNNLTMLTTSQFLLLCVFAMLYLSPFDGAMLRAQFTDVTDDYGLAIYHDIPISESGVSFHDFNRDGLDDLTYAGSGMGVYTFRNTGSGFVQEYYFAGIAGKTLHPIWVDYDNDGDADFFATRAWECPVLFRNNGDMTFEDVSDALPCPMDGVISTTATWGDYNGDGFLDVYVANYNQQPTSGDHNWLFRNNGDGTFDEVAGEAGVSYGNFPAYQCMFLDADFDHDADLLVVNDKNDGCQYFRNDGGFFTDIANENGFNTHIDAMSLSVSDVDHDGDYDYYISNTIGGNVFLINENGTFVNRAAQWNATVNANCWGSVFVDTQQKTWEDLYVVSTGPEENMNVLLQNSQGQMFTENTGAFNNDDSEFIYAVAKGDANNDGAYDIMCMPYYANGSLLFESSGSGSTWVKIALQGSTSNRDGIGSTIHCYLDGIDYVRPVTCGENFTSQDSRYIMFGLKGATSVDSIVVQWPSGIVSSHELLMAGQTHMLVEPDIEWVQQIEYSIDLCPGSSSWLDASEWPAVEWEGGSSESQLEVSTEGLVSATAWNEQGEQFALQFVINEMEVTNPHWQILPSSCGESDAAIESGNGVLLMWVNGESYTQGEAVLPSGLLTIDWVDTLGCSFSSQMEIPVVEPMQLLAQADTACFGENAFYELSALNAIDPLIWLGVLNSTGELPAGSYSVMCIDARGCKADTFIEIEERDPLTFLLAADTACAQSTTSATFSWSGAVEPIVQLGEQLDWQTLTPGYYELSWMDGAGCLVQSDFVIHEYPGLEWEVEMEESADDALITLEIEGGQPPYSIQWSNGETGESLLSWEQEVNSATITDAAGCAIATEEFFVSLGTDVSHISRQLDYLPGEGLVNQSQQSLHFYVIDSHGRLLLEDELAPGERWPCDHLPMGNYCVVQSGRVLRFVVMR
jgi:hypothetical protein